jgi:hypothetical protein
MHNVNQSQPSTKPIVRFLAGFFGIWLLLGAFFSGWAALHSGGSDRWHWTFDTVNLLFVGLVFAYVAYYGDLPKKRRPT